MKSLKNYDGNFEIFERKNKFKNHKQNYKKEKTLCGDYFIDISDYRDYRKELEDEVRNQYNLSPDVSVDIQSYHGQVTAGFKSDKFHLVYYFNSTWQ